MNKKENILFGRNGNKDNDIKYFLPYIEKIKNKNGLTI